MTSYCSKRDLSPSEKRVAWLIATYGMGNKEIGLCLKITEGTVKVHLKGVLNVLKLNNRTQNADAVFTLDSIKLARRLCISLMTLSRSWARRGI